MKTIITILTAITLSLMAINAFTNSADKGDSIFQCKTANLNRKKVAEVLKEINKAKGYELTEKSLYITADIQALSFLLQTNL